MNGQLKTLQARKQYLLLNFDGEDLRCVLTVPEGARSIILFVGCGGSSRESGLCTVVAKHVNRRGHASLLIDHLTPEEQADECGTIKMFGFDTGFLSRRLVQAAVWIKKNNELKNLNLGFFTEGGTAEASFSAGVELKDDVRAMVVSGSIAPLTESTLTPIRVPTLFLLPADEIAQVEFALEISQKLSSESQVDVIDFAEPLEHVTERLCELTSSWFDCFLLR